MGNVNTYPTDQTLAEACARCDQRAQRLLYDRYVGVMYNTTYRYCFNKEVTEDILQITFTKVFASIRRYDAKKGSLLAWMRRICINTTADVLKREAKWEPLWEQDWEMADKKIDYDEYSTELILKLIEELPKEQRTIFNLYEIEGYTHEEIAQMMGVNVNTCRVYLSRAKKQLRKAISICEGI
ncbi:MAG: RNA polymerase sigma factor [Chitinophagales bacterium]|nr:RNA polymerase sigma factor [Chitinophagales bacterium]